MSRSDFERTQHVPDDAEFIEPNSAASHGAHVSPHQSRRPAGGVEGSNKQTYTM